MHIERICLQCSVKELRAKQRLYCSRRCSGLAAAKRLNAELSQLPLPPAVPIPMPATPSQPLPQPKLTWLQRLRLWLRHLLDDILYCAGN